MAQIHRVTIFLVILLNLASLRGFSQDSARIYPTVTRTMMEYRQQVLQAPGKKMVEISPSVPGLIYDLRYAGKNNFVKKRMYPRGTRRSYLRQDAIDRLKKAASDFDSLGYSIKIFDAYRPFSVTVVFWEMIRDERYVANPVKGSGHNRGIAVDLTLVDKATGTELEMGTGFDNFTDTAHHSFSALPKDVLANRSMLKTIMEKYGFRALETEWWHYYLPDAGRYELLDLEFKQLGRQ